MKLIEYFCRNHLVTNVIFFGLLLLGLFAWFAIGKEEMPEFASNWVRVTTVYPGAAAEDVELFVTKPIEEELKGVVGIEEIRTTSSVGTSSFSIIIDDNYPDPDEVLQEIKDAVYRVNLPTEVRDLPRIRQFRSSEKAILDVGLYHKDHKRLGVKQRQELQELVLSFESQLLSRPEISSITRSHYLQPELQILIDSKSKQRLQISLSEIKNQIQANNIRVPIGTLRDRGESKVTAQNELEDVESLKSLILRSNYEGQGVRLGDMAIVQDGFQNSNSIFKVNGHEGVFLNIRKSLSTDILTAQKVVKSMINKIQKENQQTPLGVVMMDDESYAVKNRLKIISSNGLLGFALILLILFIFLDFKSGFWVAMGMPFSMAFTLIIAHVYGYTVNNMTLAGIIIVLGIVVDDAIIIAENIARKREQGLNTTDAAIEGSKEMVKPIVASIITTCVAFIPLAFFEGFFGKLVAYIPLVVILMLMGSLFESLLILPSHLSFKKMPREKSWFKKYEDLYARFLHKVLKLRSLALVLFFLLLVFAGYWGKTKLRFEMFPREESKEVVIKATAPKGSTREETSVLVGEFEAWLVQDKVNIVGVRTSVGQNRRGGEVKENEASILVELHPADEREKSLNVLLDEWEAKSKQYELLSFKFLRGRWGHDSGFSVELQIQQNDDEKRNEVASFLFSEMEKLNFLTGVELEEPILKKEYVFSLNQPELMRLSVSPQTITSTLRSFVEGSIIYTINKSDEEVDVRLSVPDEEKKDLNELLNLRVENATGELVMLKRLVQMKEVDRPVNINRINYKRTTMLYSNIQPGVKTPIEVAEYLEENLFPQMIKKYPSTILAFTGEIEDSRESQGEFLQSIIVTVIFIYLILIIMFNSLTKPFLIMLIIPFGLAGVILTLMVHSMEVYGFFAAVGALGMIGVVVNDAIIMIDKLERTAERTLWDVAQVASTRLRPVLVTTLTTVVGILPTAYGLAGYDSMLAEMMLSMGWGLAFGTFITLVLIPCLYSFHLKKS
jgi:multidrug efflux pump subunit AcrB